MGRLLVTAPSSLSVSAATWSLMCLIYFNTVSDFLPRVLVAPLLKSKTDWERLYQCAKALYLPDML